MHLGGPLRVVGEYLGSFVQVAAPGWHDEGEAGTSLRPTLRRNAACSACVRAGPLPTPATSGLVEVAVGIAGEQDVGRYRA
jgi:hypothetical protein